MDWIDLYQDLEIGKFSYNSFKRGWMLNKLSKSNVWIVVGDVASMNYRLEIIKGHITTNLEYEVINSHTHIINKPRNNV